MATLTPDVLEGDSDVTKVQLRPSGAPMFYPSFSYGGLMMKVANLRPPTTTPQFSGTVDPETAQEARLVDRRTGEVLAFSSVDPVTGAFSFDNAWQDPNWGADFGFQFIAPDGFCSQTFPVSDPIWNEFQGNPRVNDSAQGSRP